MPRCASSSPLTPTPILIPIPFADYQKHKEVDYHEETEGMNTAALWWPMLQIAILVLTGVFQVSRPTHCRYPLLLLLRPVLAEVALKLSLLFSPSPPTGAASQGLLQKQQAHLGGIAVRYTPRP